MLYIIDQLPLNNTVLDHASLGDTVVLTNNAVYALTQDDNDLCLLSKALSKITLCVRNTDLLLRNISQSELLSEVAILDDRDYADILDNDLALGSWN